jgi:hypothetical protein
VGVHTEPKVGLGSVRFGSVRLGWVVGEGVVEVWGHVDVGILEGGIVGRAGN